MTSGRRWHCSTFPPRRGLLGTMPDATAPSSSRKVRSDVAAAGGALDRLRVQVASDGVGQRGQTDPAGGQPAECHPQPRRNRTRPKGGPPPPPLGHPRGRPPPPPP